MLYLLMLSQADPIESSSALMKMAKTISDQSDRFLFIVVLGLFLFAGGYTSRRLLAKIDEKDAQLLAVTARYEVALSTVTASMDRIHDSMATTAKATHEHLIVLEKIRDKMNSGGIHT